MKKKILIIGSSGFLGKNTLNSFIKKKEYDVYALTRKKLNYPKNIKQINVDLHNYKKLFNKINKIKFNIVINLSLYVEHEIEFEKGFKILLHNLKCTQNVIKALNKDNIEKYVHIGSADEYLISSKPIKETQRLDPKNYYSLSKIFIFNYLMLLHKLNKFPVVFLRLFLIYGEGQDENRLIPYVIKNSLINKRIFLSNKKTIRDFLYISDFIDAISLIIKSKKGNGQVFNICYGKSYSIENIIKKLSKNIKNIKLVYGKRVRKYKESEKIYASNDKVKKYFNWKPKITLEHGLKLTVNSFKQNARSKS